MRKMRPVPLTKQAFAPFGDVVEMDGAQHFTINQGFAERFNDLANVDVAMDGGSTNISICVASPRPMPIAIKVMERHPLGSQIFHPLQNKPWLILVCTDPHNVESYHAFTASGGQGVNYARNVWHHPLLVLDQDSHFLIIDRKGPGDNLEELWLADDVTISLQP